MLSPGHTAVKNTHIITFLRSLDIDYRGIDRYYKGNLIFVIYYSCGNSCREKHGMLWDSRPRVGMKSELVWGPCRLPSQQSRWAPKAVGLKIQYSDTMRRKRREKWKTMEPTR